jgi:hypothetical protein
MHSRFVETFGVFLSTVLLASAVVGCSTADCPAHTVRDGNVCRRTSSANGAAAETDAGPAARADSRVGKAGDASDKSDAAAGTRAAIAGSAGRVLEAVSGASGGIGSRVSTAGTGANMNLAQAGAAGRNSVADMAAAGRSDAAGDANGGSHIAGSAGSSASVGMPTAGSLAVADAGVGTSVAGSAANNASDSGANNAGAGGSPAVSSTDWVCADFDRSCTCVAGTGVGQDLCSTPKPPCCFTIVAAGSLSCQCWPDGSDECQNFQQQDPNGARASSCPPK